MVNMHHELGTDNDDRGLGSRKEGVIHFHKVDLLQKGNKSGVFYENGIHKTSVGMELAFLPCLGRFSCTGNVYGIEIIKHREKED